jgi:hypothetical protein
VNAHRAVQLIILSLTRIALFVGCDGDAAAADWRIIIANDTCPDVTWGLSEEQTRQAFADLVRSHLDEMQRTDSGPDENRDHFNMATTQEALDFVQRYPDRKGELIRRIREGRVCVSPFLCNSLWGFQSAEGAIRTLYTARRLERDWGMPMDVAEHIELPSLPWGQATLLAGCGVRWVSVPFLDYDCTFKGLKNPPLFRWAGPDGSDINVVMDPWACSKANYAQGAYLLKEPQRITDEWVPHYEAMGVAYPLRVIFASGTHSDISPQSGQQTHGFAEGIERYNAAATAGQPRLVNGTFAQFTREVDPARGLVTCFKPADDAPTKEAVVRLWETAGTSGALMLSVPSYRSAHGADLLERAGDALAVQHEQVPVNVRGHGFAAVKLAR